MAIPVLVVDARPLVREALSRLLEDYSEFDVGPAASTLAELLLRPLEGPLRLALVGSGALCQSDEHALAEAIRQGKPVRVLVLGEDYDEEAICRLLMVGCSGYLADDATAEALAKAIGAVARGEIWAERRLVARPLHQALAAVGTDAMLTSREREILGLLRIGRTNRQIAELLFISPETVKWHLRKIFPKIGAKDRLEATLYARAHNVFPRLERAERPAAGVERGV